jgi:hypothetical protein
MQSEVNLLKILQDRSKTNVFVPNCVKEEKRKNEASFFYFFKAKKNEYNRSSGIEDLPLLITTHSYGVKEEICRRMPRNFFSSTQFQRKQKSLVFFQSINFLCFSTLPGQFILNDLMINYFLSVLLLSVKRRVLAIVLFDTKTQLVSG